MSCSFRAWLNFLSLIRLFISLSFQRIKKLTKAKIRINKPTKTINVRTPITKKKIAKSSDIIPATLLSEIMVSAAAGSFFPSGFDQLILWLDELDLFCNGAPQAEQNFELSSVIRFPH